jgi:Fic family protein
MGMTHLAPLENLDAGRLETPAILKKLAFSSRRLAELKGVAASIPNQGILINALALQEAKDSSAIENIITTHDELFKDDVLPEAFANPAAKEVLRYRQALRVGFEQVRASGLITSNHIIEIQAEWDGIMPVFASCRVQLSKVVTAPPSTRHPKTPQRSWR